MAIQSLTGYTANTPKHYLINAGVVYKNVTYAAEGGFTGTLVGATQGGVTVTIEENYRNPEVDGTGHLQGKVVGNTILESAVATVVTNLKEITAENLGLSLNGKVEAAGVDEAPAGYKKITTKRYVAASDHLTNLAVVGTLNGSDNPVIFIIDNPLCTGGAEIGTEENGETVLEVTHEAYATVAQLQADEFPWRIFFPTITVV